MTQDKFWQGAEALEDWIAHHFRDILYIAGSIVWAMILATLVI